MISFGVIYQYFHEQTLRESVPSMNQESLKVSDHKKMCTMKKGLSGVLGTMREEQQAALKLTEYSPAQTGWVRGRAQRKCPEDLMLFLSIALLNILTVTMSRITYVLYEISQGGFEPLTEQCYWYL